MKERIAGQIVKYRFLILVVMLFVTVLSVRGIGKVRINYDLNEYLADETMTKRALQVMEQEFGSSEQLQVMFHDLKEEQLETCISVLRDRPEILAVTYDPETNDKKAGNALYQLITLTLHDDCDSAAFVTELREMFPEAGEYVVGGSAAAGLDVQNQVGEQMPRVMGIAVGIVFMILLLTSHAFLEPVVILFTLGISIVINMGTNFIFPKVSFITFAVCAILQLALSIDYAIMLLHTYNGFRDEGKMPEEAMILALSRTFMRIASSAFTTIAGLLSLLFMSFTIGFDIGIVLSKGIVISMLCVFLLMPAVTLIFRKGLEKTKHKPLQLSGRRLSETIYRFRLPLSAVMIAAVVSGAFLQSRNIYSFRGDGVDTVKEGSIQAIFGESSPLVLMFPADDTDEGYDRQRNLVDSLQQMEYDGQKIFREITAMVTTGAEALKYYTAEEISGKFGVDILTVRLFWAAQGFEEKVRADRLLMRIEGLGSVLPDIKELSAALNTAKQAFQGEHYDRMILQMEHVEDQQKLIKIVGDILDTACVFYGEDYYITGVPMSVYDIGNAFRSDLLKVNLITFFAIFLIIMLSFGTLRFPVILVFVIEGAIWVTMSISYVLGKPVFFISYLICVAIQMGATIDYGILFCDQYREGRQGGKQPQEAVREAMKKSLSTILTSGSILIIAGYIIGKVCTVFYISDIGLLLSRGTLVSVLFVLFLLPAILTLER